jgi:hypothetical protein
VFDGGTRISNTSGSIELGLGGDYDFSRTLPGQAPEGLLVEPAALRGF